MNYIKFLKEKEEAHTQICLIINTKKSKISHEIHRLPVIQENPNPVAKGSPTEPTTTVAKGSPTEPTTTVAKGSPTEPTTTVAKASFVRGAIRPVIRAAGALTVLGTPLMAIDVTRSEKMKQYEFDYYYFADETGIFRLHGDEPLLSKNEYFKIYITGLPAEMGIHIPISESEFYDLWDLGKKWYGYIDFWGDWVPGTVRTKLEDSSLDLIRIGKFSYALKIITWIQIGYG